MAGAAMVVAALALATSGGGGAHARDATTCPPARAQVLASNFAVTIWAQRERHRWRTFACHRGHRRPVRLGYTAEEGGGWIDQLVVAGRFVAYFRGSCDRYSYGCAGPVVVRDLYRRTVRRWYIPDGEGAVFALRLTELGGIAWSHHVGNAAGIPIYELWVRDRSGARRIASGSGPGVEPLSLAVTRDRVYWTQDGNAHGAPLGRY